MIAQEEIVSTFSAFKEAKKHRCRNTETGGDMYMIDSDAIVQDDELLDWSNVVLNESPNDGNYTCE